MCAALLLMQAGFPTRISFEDLYQRYGFVLLIASRGLFLIVADFSRYSNRMPIALSRLKPTVFSEALLVALDLHGGRDFQMGLTKV